MSRTLTLINNKPFGSRQTNERAKAMIKLNSIVAIVALFLTATTASAQGARCELGLAANKFSVSETLGSAAGAPVKAGEVADAFAVLALQQAGPSYAACNADAARIRAQVLVMNSWTPETLVDRSAMFSFPAANAVAAQPAPPPPVVQPTPKVETTAAPAAVAPQPLVMSADSMTRAAAAKQAASRPVATPRAPAVDYGPQIRKFQDQARDLEGQIARLRNQPTSSPTATSITNQQVAALGQQLAAVQQLLTQTQKAAADAAASAFASAGSATASAGSAKASADSATVAVDAANAASKDKTATAASAAQAKADAIAAQKAATATSEGSIMLAWIFAAAGLFLALAIWTVYSALAKRVNTVETKAGQVEDRITAVEASIEDLNEGAFKHVVQKIVGGDTETLLPSHMKLLAKHDRFSYCLMVNGVLTTYACMVIGVTGSNDALIRVDGFKDPIPAKRVFAEIAKSIEAGGKPVSVVAMAA